MYGVFFERKRPRVDKWAFLCSTLYFLKYNCLAIGACVVPNYNDLVLNVIPSVFAKNSL
jgi:hypothetical protein